MNTAGYNGWHGDGFFQRGINQLASGSHKKLIRYSGYLLCQFRLAGTLVEGRYDFILCLKLAASAIPSGMALAN
ncbi:hypothetical protein DPU24_24540 [Salmonella enterica subsp. enterica serovar Oranienburg]|nr:hypothetical protein [Salmonella enterica subsp. enterica serovar Newport]EBW6363914.1 hypothetical protein [Salmonella enterica subsp. enterica serovar Oranienburg]